MAADHNDQLVTTELFPLSDAIVRVRKRFTAHRHRADEAAQWFPRA